MNYTFITGIMQGRLLPNYNGKYQVHLLNYWQEEFDSFGDRITDIHIKDISLGDQSVELVNGYTNFNQLINLINTTLNFGVVMLRIYRDEEGIKIFKKQLLFFKEKLSKLW